MKGYSALDPEFIPYGKVIAGFVNESVISEYLLTEGRQY